MAYTLLDAAYEMYYPEAEFSKAGMLRKAGRKARVFAGRAGQMAGRAGRGAGSLARRTGRAARSTAGSVVGKTSAGRQVRLAGLIAGAGLLSQRMATARAEGVGSGYKRGIKGP